MLYDLIFRRFIASQCKAAKVIKQKIVAKLNGYTTELEEIVEIVEEGFFKFLPVKVHERLKSGIYTITEINLREIPKAKPFTQGDVIALMKKKAIGRPSTYAKIIQTLLDRTYVKEVKNLLFSTKRGFVVFNFLNSYYGDYVSEEFTRKLEADMDAIEQGNLNYEDVLKQVYYDVKKFVLRMPRFKSYKSFKSYY